MARTCYFFLAITSLSYGQIDITASEASEEDFLLGTGAASYSFTITGTTPGATKDEATVKPYYYIVYATGFDIYGNQFFEPLQQGLTQVLYGPVTPAAAGDSPTEATSQTIAGEGAWGSNDSTLLNSFPLRPSSSQRGAAHQIVLALYGDGNPLTPASEPPLDDTAFASPSQSSSAGAIYFFTDAGPDLAIDEVTFNAGSYTGGDIIRMTTKWRNISFPITPGEVYKIHNYLTENAAIDWRPPTDPLAPDDSVRADNDDFLLSEYTIAGDRPVVSPIDRTPITPDGTSVVRKVEAIPLGPLVPYGIPNRNAAAAPNSFYGSTLRVYQPQPADGYLDVSEVVSVTVEVKVPENYAGTYFVAGRVDPENTVPEPPNLFYVGSNLFLEIQDLSSRRPDNNSFVSNASAKITIDGPTTSPTVEAASAIAFQDGEYVQGGGETSNQSAVSSDGNVIAFSSAARNLMVPPPLAQAFIESSGRGADMSQSPSFDGSLPFGEIGDYLTVGQQIFYRLRQTRENYLASGLDGIAANANCFNPSISSATGQYVAFDSRANNLGAANTGNRSLIYITDVKNQGIKAIRPDADGDSFNPSISANGRFVAFESLATNLDPDKPIPAGNNSQQIYLHDRDVDGNGTFDEIGNTATYLVSVNSSGQVATATCLTPSLSAWEPSRTGQAAMYVAYTSFARNLPSGGNGEQVYRAKVKVGTNDPGVESVDLVSINDAAAPANKPQGAPNGSIEPSINGDGSQVAFSSSADNLVFSSATGAYNGDTNLVPDVFVRDFKNGQTVRVSESIERVATGVISFVGPSLRVPGNSSLVNIPQNNPQPGDTLRITSGGVDKTFVFGSASGDVGIPTVDVSFPDPVGVLIGQDVCTTRDNLVSAINSAFEDVVVASATTPTAVPGETAPNMAIAASIYLRSLVLGETGNGTITFTGTDPVVVDTDLTGGGVQAEDAPLAVQGVPAGSDQPSISEDGRVVAFRTIAGNLDVQRLTLDNDFAGGPPFTDIYPPSPQQGELVRPVRFPASNVYVRNRSVDKSLASGDFDLPGNVSTTKISVNNFGYPTTVSAQQSSGIGALTTAANQTPAVGGDGRIITFSSGSEAFGGLVFGRNNLEPLDFQNARDVYIYDSQIVGVAPPPTESRPTVDLLSPINGLRVQTGSTIALAASVVPKLGKTVSSVQFYVNGAAFGPPLTSEPYSLTYQLTNPGQYIVRVVATDSRGITGLDSSIITAGPPPEGQEPPLVAVTQPASQLVNYVVGSDLMFNATAQDLDGDVTDVTFYLAGTPIPATKGFDNNWYAPFRPFKTGSFTFFASATDNDGNTSLTEVATINFVSPAASFPSVEVVATNAGLPAVAGGVYPLRARITGPVPGITYTNSNSFVLFYADGVYLGLGVLQADGTFLLDWNVPSTPRTYGKIYAYLESPNRFTAPDDDPTSVASVVVRSKNFLTLTTEAGLPLSVSLIKPTNGAQIPAGVGTLLEATALAPAGQGTISRVEFYQNGELIDAADEAFPYQIQFTPPAPGRYELVALAYSTAGVIEQSAPITVTAVQGTPPTAALQVTGGIGSIPVGSPELEAEQSGNQILLTMNAMNGVDYVLEETTNLSSDLWTASSAVLTVDSDQSGMAEGYTRMQASVPIVGGRKFFRLSYPTTAGDNFSVNQTATLEATANDSDGTVARVEFLVNGVVVETDTSFPYRFSYQLTAPGRYEIVARAYDNLGNVTDSAPKVLNANSGTPPTVEIMTPPNGLVTPQTTLSIGWRAGDVDGSVERAQLLVNGLQAVGSDGGALVVDRAADPASNPGSNVVTYTPPSQGQYVLVVRVTDNLGNVTDSAPVTVTVNNSATNPLPSIFLTQPLGVSYVAVGSEFYAAASALPASPKTIASVSFYLNGQLINNKTGQYGSLYAAPFIVTERKPFDFTTTTFNQTAVGGNELFAEAEDSVGLLNASPVYRLASYGARNALPTVQMLELYGGSDTVSIGGKVTLQARPNFPTAANQDPVVEFYANGVSIGLGTKNANNNDYSFEWSPTESGPFIVTARAQAVNWRSISNFDEVIDGTAVIGSSISDNFITLNTAPGVAPTVSITSPVAGASLPVNVPLSINATAAVPAGGQGAIQKVEFYQNGILISEDIQSPFQAEFTPLSPGTYTLIAVAYGTSGLIGSSSTVQFNAVSGAAPTVSLTTPATSPTNVAVNSTITLAANATDSDGSVVSVTFLSNGVPLSGAAGSENPDTTSPYRYNFTPTSPGRYEIVARAIDDLGNVTDSVAKVLNATSGAAPTVSISNPANTTPPAEVTPGIPVAVTVNAADSDGSVARVDLLVNGLAVGFSTQAPYIFTDAGQFSGGTNTTFKPASEGLYIIVARATDNLGNVTDSAPVTVRAKSPTPIGVAPTVQITQPIGEIYYVTGSSMFLNARATDAPPGEVDPDSVEFTVNGLPLPGVVIGQIGDDYGVRYTPTESFTIDTIRAQATDNDGNTTYSQPNYTVLNLAQSPLPQVQMLALLPGQPQDAGGEVTLRAEALFPPTAGQQARVEFYANNVYVGTATQDLANPKLYTLAWETPADAGSYAVEARAVALNFATNTENDNAIEYFGSVISDNSVAVNTTPGNAPVVTISSPSAGQAINANQPFTVRATASVPSNVSIVPPPQAVGLSVTSVPVVAGDIVAVNDPLYFVSFFGSSVAVKSTLAGEVTEVKIKEGDVVTSGLVTMTISVPGAGGTIDRVEFYTNGVLIGTDDTAPHEATFTPESVGLYNIAALAYSDAGLVGASEVVSVSSVLGTPPAVTLSGPTQAVLGQNTRLVATPSVLQAGRNIQQVEFLVNNLVVATLTAANDGSSYAYDWPVTAPGIYQVQARAIDNVQNIAFSNVLDLTSRVAPAVLLDAPTSGVIGQAITLSATVTNPTGGPVSSVQFLVNNNVIATDSVAPYSANYTIPAAGTYDLRARAIDTDGVAGLSNLIPLDVPAPPPPDPTVPSVTIIDPTAGANVLVGSSVNLVAVASPGDNATVTSVVFNVEDPAGGITSRVASQSGASYLAAFTPAIEGLYTITASVTNNRGQTATAFVGVVAQTALPVPPGTDAAFVIDMYQKILGREPTGTELVAGTDELAVPDFTRADFVYNMLMGSEYANVQNRVADFFFTLGVTPTRASFAGSVATTRSNTSLMTGFDDYYPGVSQFWASPPPFGATFGQVSAAQGVVASSLVKALDNTSLTQWMFNRLGGATASPSEVTSRLVAYSGAEQRGAAVSFLTANYENIGGLSPSLASAQQGYQYQLRATAARFLLGGPWQATGSTGTVLAPVSRLSHLEVSTPLGLLSFIERLVGDTEVVLVAPGSASATASAILGGSVTSVVVTTNGSNYTTPPSVVFEAPRFTTALATPNLGANGAVTSVTLSNSTNGYYLSAPTVSLGINGSGALATAMAEVGTGATAGRVTNIRVTAPGSGYASGLAWVRVDSPSPWQAASGSVGLSNGQITSVSVAEGGMGYPTTNPAVLVGAPQYLQGSTNAAVNFSARRFTNASLVSVSSFQLLVNGRPVATNANVSAPAFILTPATGTNRISVRAMNGNFVVGESDWTELIAP